MRLLLTNDDGIESEGLKRLEAALTAAHEVWVVAPLANRSGIGHAITLDRPIRLHSYPPASSKGRYAVDGTPADAVKMAFSRLMPERPDLVLSGVNGGPNVGVNVFYSGTVSAALESVIQGVSSIAISVDNSAPAEWETIFACVHRVLSIAESLRRRDGARSFCFNLNIPAVPLAAWRGLRVTRHSASGFEEFFWQKPDDPPDLYRIDGAMRIREKDEDFDAAALKAGYATITPLQLDLTDMAWRDKLANAVEVDAAAAEKGGFENAFGGG